VDVREASRALNLPRAADGVKLAAVRVMLGCRIVNAAQLAVALPATLHLAVRPALDLAIALTFICVAAVSSAAALRARRIVPRWIALEVCFGVAVLVVTPLFISPSMLVSWPGWTFPMTLLTATLAGMCFNFAGTLLSVTFLTCAHVSWIAQDMSDPDRITVGTNSIAFMAFGMVAFVIMRYLRSVAQTADRFGDVIRDMEQERMRRVLHTPYRLLGDLIDMLRAQAATSQDEPAQRARLAEAVTSLAEVKALVRGDTPAVGNLTTELRRLREQFADLPLLLNVDELRVTLDNESIYRVREAVRSALQNVRLHANAAHVVLYASSDDDKWLVSVYDDGEGIDEAAPRRLGLEGIILAAMKEIGARATITSIPGQGTLVEIAGAT
jgi:anti-sigma regulatory factor (Ser/Thr protein kinase)